MKTTETRTSSIVHPAQEIVRRDGQEFALIGSPDAMTKAIRLIDSNLAGQRFSPLDLARIKVPTGGGRDLQVDGASGPSSARELEGIVVAFRSSRVYWKNPYGSGSGKKPPDCSSHNGFIGVGDPGGECAKCPMAQFGSALAPNGQPGPGQACKDIRQLLVLLPGALLPHIFNLPPTSIKNWMNYSLKLIYEQLEYWEVVTRIATERSTSQGGVDYAKISFSMARKLAPDQASSFRPYHERMRALLAPMTVDASSYEVVGEPRTETSETEASTETEDEDIPF